MIFLLGLAAVHFYMARYRLQATAAVRFHNDGGKFATGPEWLRSIFGDDSFQEITELNLDECNWSEESFGYVTQLPELEVLVLFGPEVTDEHLRRLENLQNLRGLVLDSTTTTDEGIEALREAIPELEVHKSERQIVNHIATLVAPAVENENMGLGSPMLSQAPAKYDGETKSVELDGPAWLREFAGEGHFKSILSISLTRPIRSVFMGGFSDTSTPDDVFFVDDDALLGMRLGGLSRLTHLLITSRQVSSVGLAGLRRATSLTHLDLEGTRIDDEGLEHLQDLSNLKRLNLNKTKVGDRGMVHLRDLLSLEILLMSETNGSEAGLLHLENLTDLKQLDLSATPLAGLSPLRNLTKLEELDIGGCNITDDELRHLKNLDRLPRLDLSGNPTTPAALQHLVGMTNLKELSMGDALSVDDDVPLFYPLKGLKKLSFYGLVTEKALQRLVVAMPGLDDVACDRGLGAAFGVIGGLESLRTKIEFVREGKTGTIEIYGLEVLHLSEMSSLAGLKHLNFPYCLVRDEDLARLGGLPDLEELDLSAWRLTDAGFANLDRFPRLRRLKLPWRTTDAGMRHLAKAKSLETLDLDETNVTDAGLTHLAELPLKSLTFTNTAVAGNGLRHLANPSLVNPDYSRAAWMMDGTIA